MDTAKFQRKKKNYIVRMERIQNKPFMQKAIQALNWILTGIVYTAYPLLLVFLALRREPVLARAIIVPLDSFIILSAARYFINRRRPYEVYEYTPSIHKKTKGKSFPSRHVFCVFVIAVTFLAAGMQLGLSALFAAGAALVLVGALLAAVRVYSGVHFLSDVLAGAAVGVASGVIGFWIF